MSAEAFPLCWPAGFPRTDEPRRAPFKTTFDKTRRGILHELDLMGCPDWAVIISTNMPLRRDGAPYAGGRPANGDTGVAVYFRRPDETQVVLACDRWDRVEHNMRALELTIKAMRDTERWGCSDMLNRVFTGFAALPAPMVVPPTWWEAIGVQESASIEVIEKAWREKLKEAHPDAGGSHHVAVMLNQAIADARRAKAVRA